MKRAAPITCARCHTRLLDPATRIYSVHTKCHYCADIGSCARRAARKASPRRIRQEVKAA